MNKVMCREVGIWGDERLCPSLGFLTHSCYTLHKCEPLLPLQSLCL